MGERIKHALTTGRAPAVSAAPREKPMVSTGQHRRETLMTHKAFVSSTLLVAMLAFGPNHTAHAGSAAPSASASVAAAAAEKPKSAEIKGNGVPIPNGYSLIGWNATTAIEIPAVTIKQENGIFRLKAGTIANCGALVAGKPEGSFIGQELFAGGYTVTAPIIHTADCTCNGGDVCCCGDGWTCCNHDSRCCCSIVVLEDARLALVHNP
jgi:hypothetical protein